MKVNYDYKNLPGNINLVSNTVSLHQVILRFLPGWTEKLNYGLVDQGWSASCPYK